MKTLTPQGQLNDLIRSAPLHIQRHFGCDCIERALQRKDYGLFEALEIVRRHIAGEANDHELIYALCVSEKILDKKNHPAKIWRIVEAAVSLCRPCPNIIFVQQIAAGFIASYDASNADLDMKRLFAWREIFESIHTDEIKWQTERLQSLLALNKRTQSSLLFVMQQRAKAIDPVLDSYSKSLEERLFE